jgi:hypothetical protein
MNNYVSLFPNKFNLKISTEINLVGRNITSYTQKEKSKYSTLHLFTFKSEILATSFF